MRYTYNGLTFEEIGKELVTELDKMPLSELQDFKEEWQEAIQMMPPKAKNFCDQLIDIMIDIKEREQLQKDVPVRESKPGKYRLTQQDKEFIKSFAVNGEIPFNAYISAVNRVLNGLAPHQIK